MVDFSKFVRQVVIEGRISLETSFRIGTGGREMEYSLTRAAVLLHYDASTDTYEPFIPGSSLRGVVRHAAHRVARTLGYQTHKNCYDKDAQGKCIICCSFGDLTHRSIVTFRDSHPAGKWEVKERPHYSEKNRFRTTEVVDPVEFRFRVELDNPTDEDLALVLAGLDEISHKRAWIGGESSRGLGFATVEYCGVWEIVSNKGDITRRKITYMPSLEPQDHFDGKPEIFEHYSYATDDEPHGCVTLELKAETITDFHMKGIDEPGVTVYGMPIIPGSTIKGFLRRRLRRDGEKIFGSANKYASRVVVSDFIPERSITGDKIPRGTLLKGWITFFNCEENVIKDIIMLLTSENRITGRKSAERYGNRVRFDVNKAWKFHVKNPKMDITDRVLELVHR